MEPKTQSPGSLRILAMSTTYAAAYALNLNAITDTRHSIWEIHLELAVVFAVMAALSWVTFRIPRDSAARIMSDGRAKLLLGTSIMTSAALYVQSWQTDPNSHSLFLCAYLLGSSVPFATAHRVLHEAIGGAWVMKNRIAAETTTMVVPAFLTLPIISGSIVLILLLENSDEYRKPP